MKRYCGRSLGTYFPSDVFWRVVELPGNWWYRARNRELDFVGDGHYEYHVEILGDAGWGEISRNSLFITNHVTG